MADTTSPGAPPPALGDPDATQVDPATWRAVTLTMPDPDEPGNDYEMTLLEPLAWVAANHGGQTITEAKQMKVTLNYSLLVPAFLSILTVTGCEKEKTVPPADKSATGNSSLVAQAAPANEGEKRDARLLALLPGQWEAQVGQSTDPVRSHMTMDLRADKTVRLTNEMPGFQNPAEKIVNVADGRWALKGGTLAVTLESSPDGRLIPAAQREWAFEVGTEGEGSALRVTQFAKTGTGGPVFTRAGAAFAPPPRP